MAVENLPVFNSVSKDKLMNIATQVGFYSNPPKLFNFTLLQNQIYSQTSCAGARLDGQPEELLSIDDACQYFETFDLDQLYRVFYVGYV